MQTKREERFGKQRISELESALREIQKGKGAYDPDKLKHASNTIEDMKRIAIEALKENSEIKKAKLKIVALELRQGSDGHWLTFKNGEITSVINIEHTFHNKGSISTNILAWAKAQFEVKGEVREWNIQLKAEK